MADNRPDAASSTGTILDEGLRLAYLKAMGIPAWYARYAARTDISESEPQSQSPHQPLPAEPAPAGDTAAADAGQAPDVSGLDWQALQQQVSGCTRCELHQGRTRTVFGVGSQQADLLIVGEAPGAEEDRRGEPFVGRAGQLLDAMLKAIQLDRSRVYIANVLKCRPPNNRDPRTSEIMCCEPYLQRQIELLQPKIILALGRIAAHHLLLSDDSLAKLRQQNHRYNGIPLMVSYHPAYLLRNPVDKRKSWQDLLKVKAML